MRHGLNFQINYQTNQDKQLKLNYETEIQNEELRKWAAVDETEKAKICFIEQF